MKFFFCIQGVQLPADGIVRNITGEDTEAAAGTIPSFECLRTDAKMLKPSNTDVCKKQITNTRYQLPIRSLHLENLRKGLETFGFPPLVQLFHGMDASSENPLVLFYHVVWSDVNLWLFFFFIRN